MGNEGNTWLNVPVETKETELTMILSYLYATLLGKVFDIRQNGYTNDVYSPVINTVWYIFTQLLLCKVTLKPYIRRRITNNFPT
jgi:hypothetical protein